MGRQSNRKDQPRPGTREVGSLRRINIEALEPRTLFSGGHDVLRAQMEAFSPAVAQLNVDVEQAAGSAQLHTPHALGLSGGRVSPQVSSSGEPQQTPADVTAAFEWFSRFTQVRGLDVSGNVQSLGFPALPVIEIVYLQGPDGSAQAILSVQSSAQSQTDAASGCGDSSDQNTLSEIAVPPQDGSGKASPAVTRKGNRDGGDSQSDTEDAGTPPPGTYVAVALGPNGHLMRVLMDGNSAQGGGSSNPTSTPPPPAPTAPPPAQLTSSNVSSQSSPPAAQLTPLAMTPPAHEVQAAMFEASSPKPLVVQTTPTSSTAAPTTTSVPVAPEAPPATHPLGILAAAMPNVLQVPQAMVVVSDTVQTAGGMIQITNHVAQHATNLFAAIVPAESLPGTVAYSFIHLDATGFNDAVTAFANELATLSTPQAASHSTARAWEITAAVIGFDVAFLAWWYRRSRKEREEQLASFGDGMEPMPLPAE